MVTAWKSYTKICENKDKMGLIKYCIIYVLKTFSLTSIWDFKNIFQAIFFFLEKKGKKKEAEQQMKQLKAVILETDWSYPDNFIQVLIIEKFPSKRLGNVSKFHRHIEILWKELILLPQKLEILLFEQWKWKLPKMTFPSIHKK